MPWTSPLYSLFLVNKLKMHFNDWNCTKQHGSNETKHCITETRYHIMKVQMHISAEATSIQVSQTEIRNLHACKLHALHQTIRTSCQQQHTHTTIMQTLQALTLIAVTLSLVIIKQVCVEPPPSALNMKLPTAADRVLKLSIYRMRHWQLSINICCPLQQAADVNRRDRQTDGRT